MNEQSLEYIEHIDAPVKPSRQVLRARLRAMTYHTGNAGNRICDVVFVSKRTRSREKRLDKQRAKRVESMKIKGAS